MSIRGLLITLAIIGIIMVGCTAVHDDTDPPFGHSGMDVYTDHLTGVQYLGTGFGGLTPRLNADGSIHRVQP